MPRPRIATALVALAVASAACARAVTPAGLAVDDAGPASLDATPDARDATPDVVIPPDAPPACSAAARMDHLVGCDAPGCGGSQLVLDDVYNCTLDVSLPTCEAAAAAYWSCRGEATTDLVCTGASASHCEIAPSRCSEMYGAFFACQMRCEGLFACSEAGCLCGSSAPLPGDTLTCCVPGQPADCTPDRYCTVVCAMCR